MDAIAAALAAAQNEAANTPPGASTTNPTAGTELAPTQGLGGVVAPAQPPQIRSLEHMLASAGLVVEAYLSVKEMGMFVGKDKKVHDEFYVTMKLGNAKNGWVIRVNQPGQGVTYLNSYDGVSEHRSRQNWTAVVAQAQKIDGNAYISDLMELPVVLAHEVSLKEGKPLQAGTVLGLSLSYMNYKHFIPFLQEVHPIHGLNGEFLVKIGFKEKVGSGQAYGIFTFELVDELPKHLKPKA